MKLRPPPPMIHGTRITLRRHEESLAATMFEYIDRDRERLARFLPWPPMIQSVGDELAYLQDTLRQWTACTLFDFGIFRKRTLSTWETSVSIRLRGRVVVVS